MWNSGNRKVSVAVVVLPEQEQEMEMRKNRVGIYAKVAREASVL